MTELGELSFEGDAIGCWKAFLEEVARKPDMEFAERRVLELDAQIQNRYLIHLRPAKTSAIDGSLILVWDRAPHHLEIEITKDEFEWFYKGTDKPASGTELDDRAIEFIAAFGT